MDATGMKLLVSGSTVSVSRFMASRPDRIGVLLTPSNGNAEWWPGGTEWACDNDCFAGLDAPKYMRLLARVAKFRTRPLWIACPDVVADAGATWANFSIWQPLLASMDLPVALVLQDGLERFKWSARLPSTWNDLAAVFVGGSTEWKLSEHAARLTLEAHERGLLCHWGRINSRKRIRFLIHEQQAGRCWADSIDGSGFSAFADVRIPKFIRWADAAMKHEQRQLF